MLAVCGCAVIRTPQPGKIALLAPFDGAQADVGYEALYAARLALAEVDPNAFAYTLLPLEDGGTNFAADRARALAVDPDVIAVLLLGENAAAAETQAALGDLPAVIVGDWGAAPVDDDVTFVTEAPPMDETFAERYSVGNPFAPEPGEYAALTYRAMGLLLESLQARSSAN